MFLFETLKSSLGFAQSATDTTITISGIIRDKVNRPIKDTKVCLITTLQDQQPTIDGVFHSDFCAKTDKKGKFSITNPKEYFTKYVGTTKFFLGILTKDEYIVLYNSMGEESGKAIPRNTCIPISTKAGIKIFFEPAIFEKKTIDLGVMILDGKKFYKKDDETTGK